ncbi:hypothetical protein CPB85DRAFT_1254100 [Mucidula mucida]|nr:hypothetical protein CPB85DRAFT_1254100 [Mucidula mucida]
MAQIPPSRTLRLRAPVSKSYRGGRYHPYARLRPSFDTEMALILAAVETEQLAVPALNVITMLKGLDDFPEMGIEVAIEKAPMLPWRRLIWAAIGAAIVWRAVEHACGWCVKNCIFRATTKPNIFHRMVARFFPRQRCKAHEPFWPSVRQTCGVAPKRIASIRLHEKAGKTGWWRWRTESHTVTPVIYDYTSSSQFYGTDKSLTRISERGRPVEQRIH